MSKQPETLTPVVPQGLHAEETAEPDRESHGETLRMVVVAFALVLFGLTAGVLFVLPNFVGSGSSTAPPQSAVIEPAPAAVSEQPPASNIEPVDDETKAALRQEAQQTLDEIIQLTDQLEAKNVNAWDAAGFAKANELRTDGEKAYGEQRYAHANRAYQQAVDALKSLGAKGDRVLSEALESGNLALASGNAAAAIDAFTRALEIDPDSDIAMNGQQRAAVLDEVIALINEGSGYEELGEPDKAIEIYQQALALDDQAAGARAAISRINAQKTEDKFNRAMSQAIRDLENKQYQKARKSFLAAKSIKPGSREVADAIAEVDNLIKAERINASLKNAAIAEQNENWNGALKHLNSAAALDKDIDGVSSRITRARARAQLSELLTKFTREKERLRSDPVHQEAQAVLAKARAAQPHGQKLKQQIANLERTITLARTPVPVTLLSDAQTDITVYKVGTIGSFERKAITLLPGRYVAVGKRRGFRDVRVEFDVDPGGNNGAVDIRCIEKVAFGSG